MAIYVKNKEGVMETYKIVGLKGENGVTPDIQIGTVTTLEPGEQATVTKRGTKEEPIFDFGIPKGEKGKDGTGGGSSSNASIDDTTISTDKTWSSSKIENFVLTNNNTIWKDVNGENLSIKYTKEGYLREVEIWGNTIQDQDNLSDIKHLGELYVDDDGKPKLDSQGRNQYKVEISVLDGFNIYQDGLIKVDKNKTYHFGWTKNGIQNGNWHIFTINAYDNNRGFIGQIYQKNIGEDDIKIPDNCSFIEIKSGHGGETFLIEKSFWDKKDSIKNIFAKQNNVHKTTILIPCQLSKVGNISDRLYWDGSKGRYVVEKNIFNTGYIDRITGIDDGGYPKTNTQRFMVSARNSETINMNGTVFAMSPDIQFVTTSDWGKDIPSIQFDDKRTNIRLLRTVANTVEEANIYLNTHPIHYYFISKTPQLIDTDIREELKLPTYINNTYISVNGGIQGSIKAKAPVDGGKVIANLQRENVELKATNDTQDELINTTMLATDEMFMMLEPLLAEVVRLDGRSVSKMVDMYVAMVQRGIKTIDQVPARYREQVKKTLEQLEK